jgi:hypothetical protein
MPVPPPSLPRALLAAGLSLAGILAVFLLIRGAGGLYGEDGPVEIASVLAYAGAAAAVLLSAPAHGAGPFWQVPAVLLLAAGRELDLDKSLLSGGILKSRFYLGDFPLWEKALGLAAVAFALWAIVRLVRRGWPVLRRDVRLGAAWPWLAAGGTAGVLGAKALLDGLDRRLAPLGIEVPEALGGLLSHAEEWIELGGAVAILLSVALWAYHRARFALEGEADVQAGA